MVRILFELMTWPLDAGSAFKIITSFVKIQFSTFKEPETSSISLLKLIIELYAERLIPVLSSPIFEDSFTALPFLPRSSTNRLTLTFRDYS
jgi:hypothetical protein